MLIVFGMPTVGKVKNVIYNSSIIVSPDEEIYSYDKLYLPTHSVFEEKRYFRPGNKVKTFDVKGLKIGMSICYDLYFPEIYRILTLEGSELVICISASPSTFIVFPSCCTHPVKAINRTNIPVKMYFVSIFITFVY